MKKHFLITLLLLYSVSAFNQVATIGTYSSQNTGQTYRSIHDFIGLNGANTLTQTSFFSNADVNIQLRDFRPSYLRYPGGTLANYWDWQEGWLFRGISNNGCISLLPDYQKRIRTNPVFVAGSLNDHGSDYLKDLKTSIIGTGAKPLIVVNPLTSDLNYQLAMLLYAKEINLPSPRVEIGNEFYLPRCAYQKQFNSAYQYANLVVDWESAIHDYVSADIKISAVASNADPQNSSTDRRDQWNSDLYAQFGNSVTPDAFSIHQYKSTNLDLTDVLGPTLYSKVFGNVSNDIISTNSYIQQLHNPQDIWLTEFSVLSDDRPIHGTWYHGLYNAYLTLRFLDIENISSTNMHAMAGDYIFSGFFNNSTGFNSGSSYPIYMKTACNGSIPSTVPYGKTAVGMTSSLLSQAFTGSSRARPIIFTLPTMPTINANDNAIYGWVFLDDNNVIRKAVILNLSDIAIPDLDLSAMFGVADDFTQLSTLNPESIVNETSVHSNNYKFTNCSGSTNNALLQSTFSDFNPNSTFAELDLPPFSITMIRNSQFFADHINIIASQNEIALGSEVILTADNDTNYRYRWSTGDSTFSTVVAPIADSTFYLDILQKGTQTVLTTKQITIHVFPPPILTLSNITSGAVCKGKTITLRANVNYLSASINTQYRFVWITGPVDNGLVPDNKGLFREIKQVTSTLPSTISSVLTVDIEKPTLFTVYITDGRIVLHKSLLIDFKNAVDFEKEYRLCLDPSTGAKITLNPSPVAATGINSTFNWTYNGVNGTSTNSSNTNIALPTVSSNGVLSVDVTENGCSSHYDMNLMVTNCCKPKTTSPDPVVHSGGMLNELFTALNITPSAGGAILYDCSSGTINFEGITYIKDIDRSSGSSDPYYNDELELENCNLNFSEGARLEVAPGFTLRLTNCNLTGCSPDTMWQGLVVNEGNLYITHSGTTIHSTIKHAENAIILNQGAYLNCTRTDLIDNLVGIKAKDVDGEGFNLVGLIFKNAKVLGVNATPLPKPYTGQAIAYATKPLRGFDLEGVTANIGPGTTTSNINQFTGLNEGVRAVNCVLYFTGTNYTDILGDQNYADNTGIGIYSLGARKRFSLMHFEGMGTGSTAPNSFDNCKYGIWTMNTDHETVNALFRNPQYGIVAGLNDNSPIVITDNNITASKIGIDLEQTDYTPSIRVAHNQIHISGASSNRPIGIFVNDFGMEGSIDRYISCNTITTGISEAGISLYNVNGMNVVENSVSGNDQSITVSGITATNTNYTNFISNTVSKATNATMSNSFYFSNSPDNFIDENETDGALNGFHFNGNCASNDNFKENNIYNHENGLLVDAGAIMGTQFNTGNEWLGSYSDKGARNNELDLNKVILSRFDIDNTLLATFTPNPVWPITGWFFTTQVTYVPITPTPSACEAQRKNPPLELGITDENTVHKSINYEEFNEGQYFQLSQNLFKKIIKIQDSVSLPYQYVNFKDSIETTSINILDSSSGLIFNSYQDLNLVKLNSSINELQNAVLYADSIETLEPAITNQYLASITKELTLLDQKKKSTKVNVINLLLANSNITLPVWTEKFMTRFYMNHFYIYNIDYTPSETDTLFFIANLCPFEGGKAVYKARAALRWVNDSLEYFDDINCQTASSRLALLSTSELEVALNGNPLSEESMLLFSDKIPNGTFLRIYSSDSKLIQIIALPENSTTYSLGKLKLASGLYMLKISSPGLNYKTIKLSKR